MIHDMIDYYWDYWDYIRHWNETGLACRTCFDGLAKRCLEAFSGLEMAAFLQDAQTTATCPDNWQHARQLQGLGSWFRPILPMVQVGLGYFLSCVICVTFCFRSFRSLSDLSG